MLFDRATHWDKAYAGKGEAGVSWFQLSPDFSLSLIESIAGGTPLSVIDIGGGASRLVDAGVARGWSMAVLDVSHNALDIARERLGAAAGEVDWIVADITVWRPLHTYDVWHDRAVFHFLTDAGDRAAYADRLRAALKSGGHAVIATFAPDGPERCSGLPVQRYDAPSLHAAIGDGFRLAAAHREVHATPWGSTQSFQFSMFERT